MAARGPAAKRKIQGELARPLSFAVRPLFRLVDHGDPIRIEPSGVGAAGDRWIDGFLQANKPYLRRLDLRTEVETRGGVRLVVHPGSHIGAVPLVSPATRRVAAGLLEPRVLWPFPDEKVLEVAGRAKAFLVPEMNLGQMSREVERASRGAVVHRLNRVDGNPIPPTDIVEKIKEVV